MKSRLSLAGMMLAACLSAAAQTSPAPARSSVNEAPRPTGGVVNFLAPANPDPLLQHSKEIFVLNGCAYCHGVDLKVRNGEAADLLHSKLVGLDEDGNLIVPLLKAGIPQTPKLSPMPRFSYLSDANLHDLARWIHYARQQQIFEELSAMRLPQGSAEKGHAQFQSVCAPCHSASSLATRPTQQLAAIIMLPPALRGVRSYKIDPQVARINQGRTTHGHLLENYSPQSLSDMVAYLSSLK